MVLFDFTDYAELLPLITNSLIAGGLLAVVGGLIGIFVNNRDMSFAVHGISELSFAGAAIALLFGVDVVFGSLLGSLVAAGIIGWLGARARERNSIVAVLMPAGLGLGILALSLYAQPTSSACSPVRSSRSTTRSSSGWPASAWSSSSLCC
jgi:zinc/manganese transport system permease protein